MDDDYDEISELPEYSAKSEFSKAAKTAEAFTKVIDARAKEMKPGYFNYAMDKSGMLQKIWIPDARVVFIGAVEALKAVLAPEIARDENYNKAVGKLQEEVDDLGETYAYEEVLLVWSEENGNNVAKYKKTGNYIIPEIGDEVITIVSNDGGIIKYGPVKGGWDLKVNRYRNQMVEIYDQLFAELSKVIDRINYFKTGLSF